LRGAADQGVAMWHEVRFGPHAGRNIMLQTGRETGPKVRRIKGREIAHATGLG